MTMATISDEAVETAARTYYTNLGWDWDELDTDLKDHDENKAAVLREFRLVLEAALPHLSVLEALKPVVVDRAADDEDPNDRIVALDEVFAEHVIECTGPGEVSCRGCRDAGWMSWGHYHRHLSLAVLAALYPKATEGKS